VNAVQKRACCASFPGMAHTRVCEARRTRDPMPRIIVRRCRNLACRVLSFDAADGSGAEQSCPSCDHTGEAVIR
jgi:PIN domain nuclease of toxin-antitoxin system